MLTQQGDRTQTSVTNMGIYKEDWQTTATPDGGLFSSDRPERLSILQICAKGPDVRCRLTDLNAPVQTFTLRQAVTQEQSRLRLQ